MNCELVEETILLAEDPERVAGGDSEVSRHLAGCDACRGLFERLVRLERLSAAMPRPAESEASRVAVLEAVRSVTGGITRRELRPRRLAFVPAWIGAVAATLVVGVGLSVVLWPKPAPAATVVERIIDWDLALADAPGAPEREALYTSQAGELQTLVSRSALDDEDRRFATTLLENGAWLRTNHDPVERTEKFCDLADLLVGRMDAAAAKDDALLVQRLGNHYGRVQRGIGRNLERIDGVASMAPERLKRLEKIQHRAEEQRRRLEALAEHSPKKAQRALRMLEQRRARAGGGGA